MNTLRLSALGFVLLIFTACSDDAEDNNNGNQTPTGVDVSQTTIWSGAAITFQKAAGADPTLPENQDRITDNVWITRPNNGGQIYNIVAESTANKDNSPEGTLWALYHR